MSRYLVTLFLACCGTEPQLLVPNTMTYDGATVVWERTPISVRHTDEVPPHTRVAIEHAMRFLNDAAGCTIFSLNPGSPMIETKASPGTGGRWVGTWFEGYFVTAYIRIGTTGKLAESIALHELMHALGFLHVDDPSNIMNPIVGIQPALTAEQTNSLNILYCGGSGG